MKISEMTLEQLQDYALNLEQDNKNLKESALKKDDEIKELNVFNKTLQKRNNELFMQVEQQGNTPDEGEKEKPPVPVKTCEEFAREYTLGGKKL